MSSPKSMGVGLLLFVLTAGVVHAEDRAPLRRVGPGYTADTSPLLTSRPVRMTFATAGGLLGGVTTIVTSTLAVCLVTAGAGGYCAISGAMLGVLLSPLGIGAGVWLTGKHLDGNGSYLAAALAAAGGLVAGVLLFMALAPTPFPDVAVIMGAVTLPAGFSALAYELTSDASRSQSSIQLAPAVLRNSPGLVLSGTF